MKISGSQFQQIAKMYQKNSSKVKGNAETVKNDKVNLSRQAQELKKIHEILNQTSDVRIEKVKSLKQVIQQGTYEIKGEKIAEKMIEGYFFDKLVK